MRLLKLALLLAAVSAALAVDDGSTLEDLGASNYNATSPFVKIIRTTDVKVRDAIYASPASVFIGKWGGDVLRCLQNDRNQCEVFYKGQYVINSMTLHMEYLYIADGRIVLKCESYRKQSCRTIFTSTPGIWVYALSVGQSKIFMGLSNGTLLVSELRRPTIYRTLHTFTNRTIRSLKQFDKYIYVGLSGGELMQCSLTAENRCTLIHNATKTNFNGLLNIGNMLIGAHADGLLWNCSRKSDATSDYCVPFVSSNITDVIDFKLFNSDFYLLSYNMNSIHICKLDSIKCTKYADHGGLSMAFEYETYQMQDRYRNENRACTWQSGTKCPPYVTYFDVDQRIALEVHVKEGRLYNSEGALVDTSEADEGRSGPAAIFVMGPDGRILLSSSHKKYLLHTSSLSAGSPVAGAGEMVVKNGMIEHLTACAEHYQPNLQLNSQVVKSLRSQGYGGRIESKPCHDELELSESTN